MSLEKVYTLYNFHLSKLSALEEDLVRKNIDMLSALQSSDGPEYRHLVKLVSRLKRDIDSTTSTIDQIEECIAEELTSARPMFDQTSVDEYHY
jgi:hypothetical protein